MLIDTHCHLYKEYYDDIESIIKLSKENKVMYYINNGCDAKSNIEVLELVEKYPSVYGALGIHPEYVENYTLNDIKFIEDNLNNKKIVAIGEIGLDYHYSKENKYEQIKLLELQLKLAEKYDMPVIIHSRDATEDTINTLKKYKVKVVIAVGALAYSKDYVETLKNANNIKLPFFYLRGGIDYSKLNFFFRKFLPIIGKDIAKDDKELLNLFKNGGDFVTKNNLEPCINYLKNI